MAATKTYRPVVRAEDGDYSGAAIVGSHSCAIGWTVKEKKRPKDLKGFAIRRTDYNTRGKKEEDRWLNGQKRFEGTGGDIEAQISSEEGPFQRFRWSDYTLKPGRSYTYEVFPMTGRPGALTRLDPLRFNVRPSQYSMDGVGIYVNRGVTAAMAYLRRFEGRHPEDIAGNKAYAWLERGLKQSLFDFISRARAGEALHVGIYEFFDHEVAAAFKAAKKKGVDVRIVYHAKHGTKAAHESEDVLRDFGLKRIATARTNVSKISHNKFVVHLTRTGKPKRLWTASANFSQNAFYFQTNVALVLDNPEMAAAFEEYWQILQGNEKSRGTKGKVIDLISKLDASPPAPASRVLFSPVRSQHVVETAIELIQQARSALFLSAPFGIGNDLIDAIEANKSDIIEYGLANATAKRKIAGLRKANTRFFTPSRLKTYMGRKWDAKAFGAHKIHAKTLVIDPWGDDPAVLIGSANFSKPSCLSNDENTLLVRGDKRFAAMIATEFFRMYDHYKIRYWVNKLKTGDRSATLHLDPTSKWADIYFKRTKRSRKFRDREVFSGNL